MRQTRSALVIAAGSYLGVAALIVGFALRSTRGVLVYSLDDPYIHMALAQTLAHHGVYGIGPDAYESASSSPAWTVLLAAIARVVSSRLFNAAPLILNLVAGLWILWVFATRHPLFGRVTPVVGAAIAALLPAALYLPGLAVTGMEHTLHAALTLTILLLLESIAEHDASTRAALMFYVLLAVAALVRPEAMLFGLACSVALLASKNVGAAARTLAASMLPVGVVGVINELHGQYFLPNSVVAKTLLEEGGLTPWAPHAARFVDAAREDPMLMALFLIILTYWIASGRMHARRRAAPCLAFLLCTILHINYAGMGWLDRYQGYLIVMGVFLVLAVLADVPDHGFRWLRPVAAALVLVVFPWGKFQLMERAPVTIANVYRAQYQLARFLAQYYPGRMVAVNDLGLIGLLHGTPLIDLYGLGSHDVLRAWKEDRFDASYVDDLARRSNVQIAVVYEEWFGPLIPPEWVPVVIWTLNEPDVSDPWRVVFYAPSEAQARELDQNVRAFTPSLAGGVVVQFVAPQPTSGDVDEGSRRTP
jgi:hypothetical protein